MNDSSPDTTETRTLIRSYLQDVNSASTGSSGGQVVSAKEATRGQVTRIVMFCYGLGLIAAVLMLIVDGWRHGTYDGIFDHLLDLLKTFVLPVVTFVLGHYYAASER